MISEAYGTVGPNRARPLIFSMQFRIFCRCDPLISSFQTSEFLIFALVLHSGDEQFAEARPRNVRHFWTGVFLQDRRPRSQKNNGRVSGLCACSRRRWRRNQHRSRRSRPPREFRRHRPIFRPEQHPDRATHSTAPLWSRGGAQAGRVQADRRLVLLGRAVRHRRAGRLREHARRNPRRSSRPRCRSTACCSACTARWWRTATTTARATCSSACARSSGRRCVIGVELDPHCHLTEKRVRGRRRHRPVQGVPAHRFRRARRGTGRRWSLQDDPRRHQAGDVAVRLRHDRRCSRPRASRPRLRRPHEGARRQRRRALGLARATASRRATCPRWARACWSSPTTPRRKGDALARELGEE